MNRFQYANSEGETPAPGPPLTGWAFSDAVIQRSCPKCKRSAGFHCETPAGAKYWPPHSARIVYDPKTQIIRPTKGAINGNL